MSLASLVRRSHDEVQAFNSNPKLPEEQQIPPGIVDKLHRSSQRLSPLEPYINERYEFFRGNHYVTVDYDGKLSWQATKTARNGRGKRPWVARKANNLIMDIVAHEVSASTQRIPGYEITPTSADPEKRSAAHTSELVALYGYNKWNIRQASVDMVTHAVVGGMGFAWPYFDTSIGPMIRGRNGQAVVGVGDVRVKVYGMQDVAWEPGVRFNDSPYHIVKQAYTPEAVKSMPGYVGGDVSPDYQVKRPSYAGSTKAYNVRLVLVFDFLEQPSPKFPLGRWLTIANNRVIVDHGAYPTPDSCCLIPLSYMSDPDNDRDMSLVQHLLDPQRTFNDAWNKIVEWKNLAINPQIFVAPGVLQGQKITTEPGVAYEIPDPDTNIKFREVPQFPQELFQIAQDSAGLMAQLAAQNDIPQQIIAGKAIQVLIERDQERRQSFLAYVAEMHARIMCSCLELVQEYYVEPRLLQIKGRWSADTIPDFRGADLRHQTDVRVAPGSIEPRTKAAMEQKIMGYADRGWITPQQAMAAIEGGYSADLVTSFDLDVGRAVRIIARLKAGEEAIQGGNDRVEIGPDGSTTEVPDYMPRRFDNIPVQKSIWEDWMKTEEFEALDQPLQAIALMIYNALLKLESQQQAQQVQAQQAAAQQAGQANAAAGAGTNAAMPDAPATSDTGGDIQSLPTQNQPPEQSGPTPGL